MTVPTPEQGTHFWFMTLQAPTRTGFYLNSYQGTRTPEQGLTRLDLFNSIKQEIEHRDPLIQGATVIAFDIQPNQL